MFVKCCFARQCRARKCPAKIGYNLSEDDVEYMWRKLDRVGCYRTRDPRRRHQAQLVQVA